VCGEDVFYYQNEFGSRVYFDELGPPWPKHPCTDNSAFQCPEKGRFINFVNPTLRDRESIAELCSWFEPASWDPEEVFRQKYGAKPWGCWEVLRRVKGAGKSLLILSAIDSDKTMYLAAERLPRTITIGSMVFYKRLRLGYFDAQSMGPRECSVERLGAKEFVETQFGLEST